MHASEPRDAALQRLLVALGAALTARCRPGSPAAALAARIDSALATAGAAAPVQPGHTLPVCAQLTGAIATARDGPCPAVAGALADLAPRLRWTRRPGATDPAFRDSHASTRLTGPEGLERRDDVVVGVSLLAPRVRYPDHQHPPEELYLVLSAGQWRQQDGPWHEPGPGGIVHNPPGIRHAMRSGGAPLLAIWCLWTGA